MMTRAEFNAYWLPTLNKTAARHGLPGLTERDLDGLWHNYLMGNDRAYNAMITEALVEGRLLDDVRRLT